MSISSTAMIAPGSQHHSGQPESLLLYSNGGPPTAAALPRTIPINRAPGILDRRRSSRPSSRLSQGPRRSSARTSLALSMADMAAEMRNKDADDDDGDDKHDTFEDAVSASSTPRPASVDANAHGDVDGHAGVNGDSPNGGLGISGADKSKQSSIDSDTVHTVEATAPPPSTAHRERSMSPATQPTSQPASRSQSPAVKRGLTGDLPIVPMPPPSTTDRMHALEQRNGAISPPVPAPGLARKASSGFGALLGRMGSIRKARSPPAPRHDRFSERRGTASSMASVDSNGLATIQDGRPSLQDQFSSLRRQEEFTTHEVNGHVDADTGKSTDRAHSDVHAHAQQTQSPVRSERASSTGAMKSPPLNPSLPPGTASGMSAGPAQDPSEVNWDLWQQVVYDGPGAVARTSGEELNQAITSGIPPAIRGVVWQVLAESKNEELENVYRTLKARGTDAELRPTASRPGSRFGVHGAATEKDAATSDASSEHSDHSGTANSGVASPPTSVDSNNGTELRSKLLEEKLKREAASLFKLEKAIKRDMGTRTSYSTYTKSAGLQDGLFGVCKAYALFDEGVGYAQGINFIAMPLLFNMNEEEAFTLLVRLMSKYDLRSLFTADMPGLHMRLYHFERLLEQYEPAVYCHLRRRNVTPQLYATQWFLTLFAYRFPLQLVLRIYDLILSEGLTAILKFGIVLMQRNREALLEIKDMSQLANFLKERLFDVYIDKTPSASSLLDSGFFGSVTGGADKELYRADEMVRDACKIKISDETLEQYTVEWEEQQRTERARDSELETLRTSTVALTSQVKGLEERVQQHDAEHVSIAQDLVKIKVENDSLLDENEALKLQVTELQKMVDAQPAEVEAKLREEMDRIMQRNMEVQNENRHLKEEMDEMEHELVNAKMAHAQTQADYETIKQKWSNVQTLLNESKA